MRKTKRSKTKRRNRKHNYLGKARIKYYSIKKGGATSRSRTNSNRLRSNGQRSARADTLAEVEAALRDAALSEVTPRGVSPREVKRVKKAEAEAKRAAVEAKLAKLAEAEAEAELAEAAAKKAVDEAKAKQEAKWAAERNDGLLSGFAALAPIVNGVDKQLQRREHDKLLRFLG